MGAASRRDLNVVKGSDVHPKRGYLQLRKGRRSIPKHYYLITTKTYQRTPFLRHDASAQVVLGAANWLDQNGRSFMDTIVIMTDHVHLLGQLEDQPLEKIMQQFKSFTSKKIGRLLHQTGSVWQKGYHDHAVRRDEDLDQIRMYCLNNPVRARIVDNFHDYPYWYSRWNV